MNNASGARVVIEMDKWMRGTGLPYWTVAAIREMKVGDSFIILDYTGPGLSPEHQGRVSVAIDREHGAWVFSALWLAQIGRNAHKRGHIFVSCARFKLIAHRRIEVSDGSSLRGMHLVRLILRRSFALSRWARLAGEREAAAALDPSYFRSRTEKILEPEGMAEEWLAQIS